MREAIRRGIREHPIVRAVLESAPKTEAPVYLVGGAIRDFGLGLVPRDLDFATEKPYEMALFFAERYGTRVVSLGKEVAPTYRIPLEGVYLDWVGLQALGLPADLQRRDFTINAIAYDPDEDRFHDPTGGLDDLRDLRLRMTGPSAMGDDPVRVLKAFRMLAQIPGLSLDPATEEALAAGAEGLMDSPPERLASELQRLMEAPGPGPAVVAMARLGVLFVLIPEMRALENLQQNDYHHTDVLQHTLLALAATDGNPAWLARLDLPALPPERMALLRLALLFHDLGKADTRTVDAEGRVHFYGHPKPSADRARDILRRLRFGKDEAEDVADLCLNHLRPLALIKTSPRRTAIRRLIHSMGDLLPLLLALAYADKSAARGRDMAENLEQLAALSREVMAVSRSEGDSIRKVPKLVDGLEALGILGMVRPGPALGKALDALMERQVEGAIADAEEARAFLQEWRRLHLET